MTSRLAVDFRFCLVSGVHVTGERAELWTDKALVLDWREVRHPVVPATTLKGWLRDGAERALRSLGVQVCDASSASTICGRCSVCEAFGHPGRKSPLRFRDARLSDALRDMKMSASLSRHRKTAYEERLFSTEVAWAPVLEGTIDGIFSSPDKALRAAALLWLGAKMGFAIGAARSRGLGWLGLESFQTKVDNEKRKEAELAQQIQEMTREVRGMSI